MIGLREIFNMGKSEWYFTTVEMDKYNITDIHGPWHEPPVGDSISVDDASTVVPHAVVTTRTGLTKQINFPTNPLNTKKTQIPSHNKIKSHLSHKAKKCNNT